MDRNSYIPTDSCHHRTWLETVPQSQFIRLRRNCTMVSDFDTQVPLLKNRLIEKGYNAAILNKKISQVRSLDWKSLIADKPKPNETQKFKWSFITTFSRQHYQIKKIFKKHWSILKNDLVLAPILPDKPGVVFEGFFFHNLVGYYPCNKCGLCQVNSSGKHKTCTFSFTTTAKTDVMGKTWTFSIGLTNISIRVEREKGTHCTLTFHTLSQQRPQGNLLCIDKYTLPWRGGSTKRSFSQIEVRWIYELKFYVTHGINMDWDINAFINNFW